MPGQDGECVLTGISSYLADNKNIRVFFDETGTQNPSGAQPNWYYYWKQTGAYYGTVLYDPSYGETGITQFVGGEWVSYLGTIGNTRALGGCWGGASGIDFFANMCRHEAQHKTDMGSIWGATTNRNDTDDPDGDFLKTAVEPGLVPGHAYIVNNPTTFLDTFGYTNPAGGPLMDCEDYCLRFEPAWTSGSANSVDWAKPGKQW